MENRVRLLLRYPTPDVYYFYKFTKRKIEFMKYKLRLFSNLAMLGRNAFVNFQKNKKMYRSVVELSELPLLFINILCLIDAWYSVTEIFFELNYVAIHTKVDSLRVIVPLFQKFFNTQSLERLGNVYLRNC